MSITQFLIPCPSDSFHQTLLVEYMQLFQLLHRLFSLLLYVFLMLLLFNYLEGVSFAATLISVNVFPHREVSLLLCPQHTVLLAIHELVILIQHVTMTYYELLLLLFVHHPNLLESFLFFFI